MFYLLLSLALLSENTRERRRRETILMYSHTCFNLYRVIHLKKGNILKLALGDRIEAPKFVHLLQTDYCAFNHETTITSSQTFEVFKVF